MRPKDFKQWETLDLVRSLEKGLDKVDDTDASNSTGSSHDDIDYKQQILSVRGAVEKELRDQQLTFLDKASERAQSILAITDIGKNMLRVRISMNWVQLALYLVMAVLGAFAVTKLFSTHGQVNIFKMLLLLLGVNLISMLLYCLAAIQKQARPSLPTTIYKGLSRLVNRFKGSHKGSPQSSTVFLQSWAKMNLSGSVGKWTFARMINAAWSSYLFGGLLALLTVLSFKQVEFIWGTTILSSDSFLSLTKWLAYLPEILGLSVPNEEQIISSRLAAPQAVLHTYNSTNALDINRIWAHFLIACVLLYGLVPRFFLWLHAVIKQWFAKRSYHYNTNTPYFVGLRERLTPHIEKIGITDADTHKSTAFADAHLNVNLKDGQEESVGDSLHSTDQYSPVVLGVSLAKVLPTTINGVAYEWSQMEGWPITNFAQEFGNITNRADQKSVLNAINSNNAPLAICIKSNQVADRGAQRFFSKLAAKVDLYILIISESPLATDKARWAEWMSLSEQIGVSPERLFFVDMRDGMKNTVDRSGS